MEQRVADGAGENASRQWLPIRARPLNPGVLAYATTRSHRARAQSAVADGTRARDRTLHVHGINATSVTAYKPPFPISRIMRLISVSLSISQFLPEQRVDQDGMIQLHDRSSTSTSTSTKNSQNITMHRSGRSAALDFRNHFGGHSVMVAVMLLNSCRLPDLPDRIQHMPRLVSTRLGN